MEPEKIFSIDGRLSRGLYAKYMLIWFALIALAQITGPFIATFLIGDSQNSFGEIILNVLAMIYFIGGGIFSVRRLHDLNKSGVYILLFFVPLICVALFIYLFFAKGTVGWNEYGADPLAE